LNTNSNTNRF